MKRLRKHDDGDNTKAAACKIKQISRERLHQKQTTEEQSQVRQHNPALESAQIEQLSPEKQAQVRQQNASHEAAKTERLSPEKQAQERQQHAALEAAWIARLSSENNLNNANSTLLLKLHILNGDHMNNML